MVCTLKRIGLRRTLSCSLMKAMILSSRLRTLSIASKMFRESRTSKPAKVQEKTLADYSLEELKAEIQKREKLIAKEHYAKQLECSIADLPKVVESILALL